MNEAAQSLCDAWNKASGQELSYRATERIFYELHKLEFLPSDVTAVVKYMLAFNKKSGAKFRINAFTVCADVEKFAGFAAEAKALERNRREKQTASEKIMEQFRPTVDPELSDNRSKGNGVHVREIFKNLEKQ